MFCVFKIFPKQSKLNRHVTKYTCPTCNSTFKRVDHFESHKQVCHFYLDIDNDADYSDTEVR